MARLPDVIKQCELLGNWQINRQINALAALAAQGARAGPDDTGAAPT